MHKLVIDLYFFEFCYSTKNLPGVYTKLAMLTDWIYDYIGKDAGRDPACNVEPLVKERSKILTTDVC